MKSTGIKGISKICVKDDKVKKWLKSNTKGIVIKTLPTFLIAQEGVPTKIYPHYEYDVVINSLCQLLN